MSTATMTDTCPAWCERHGNDGLEPGDPPEHKATVSVSDEDGNELQLSRWMGGSSETRTPPYGGLPAAVRARRDRHGVCQRVLCRLAPCRRDDRDGGRRSVLTRTQRQCPRSDGSRGTAIFRRPNDGRVTHSKGKRSSHSHSTVRHGTPLPARSRPPCRAAVTAQESNAVRRRGFPRSRCRRGGSGPGETFGSPRERLHRRTVSAFTPTIRPMTRVDIPFAREIADQLPPLIAGEAQPLLAERVRGLVSNPNPNRSRCRWNICYTARPRAA